MLGRRNPQRSLFEAQTWPHRVPPDSFYARLGAVIEQLFTDDDLAEMYCLDNGRPSLPPSLMSGILLLQFYDDVSDAEAVTRLAFDLRWKVALTLGLDFDPPHSSSLSIFRSRLLEHGQERYAFDRLLAVGRASGFLAEKLSLLIDTTPQLGAGAVQDTYTLIRKGIRRLLKAAGYQAAAKRRGLATNLVAYLESDRKAEIDWHDPAARAAQLKVLAADARAALELALPESDDTEVRAAGWLLTKILGDDLVTDEHGDPQIGRGVAPDRVISLTDPEMRHGHKSAAKHFDGRKVQVATDVDSELVLAVEPMPANRTDGADSIWRGPNRGGGGYHRNSGGRDGRARSGRYQLRHGRQPGGVRRARDRTALAAAGGLRPGRGQGGVHPAPGNAQCDLPGRSYHDNDPPRA
jgi:Transposase domain (DUF772)